MQPSDKPCVVVGVDGSDGAARALQRAIDETALRGGSLVAVHALSPWSEVLFSLTREAFDEWQRTVTRVFEDEWCAPLAKAEVSSTTRVVEDTPARALIRVAAEYVADTIVVGSHGHGLIADGSLGSVPHQLLQHSHVPVLVMPHRQEVPASIMPAKAGE